MMYDVKTAVLENGECYVDVSVSPILLTRLFQILLMLVLKFYSFRR